MMLHDLCIPPVARCLCIIVSFKPISKGFLKLVTSVLSLDAVVYASMYVSSIKLKTEGSILTFFFLNLYHEYQSVLSQPGGYSILFLLFEGSMA